MMQKNSFFVFSNEMLFFMLKAWSANEMISSVKTKMETRKKDSCNKVPAIDEDKSHWKNKFWPESMNSAGVK